MRSLCMAVEITSDDFPSEREIEDIFFDALEGSGLHVRRAVRHEFYPAGLTVVAILSESHAAVSTWPELGVIQFDLFYCGKAVDKINRFAIIVEKRVEGRCKKLLVDRQKFILTH